MIRCKQLWDLTVVLAQDSTLGRDKQSHRSLSGQRNTTILDLKKLGYTKKVVYSRCPKKSLAELEFIIVYPFQNVLKG